MRKLLVLIASLLTPALLVAALTQSAAASTPSLAGVPEAGDPASAASTDCVTGTQESGAEYLICTPDAWDTDDSLLVYAHGYMAPNRPIEIPGDQMVINGVSITETVTLLGYAFATTSYSQNGLAVLPAISDLLDLVNIFTTTKGLPYHIYLAGVSEGGLITTLSVERHPDIYDGGLAMCGPYGDFHGQVNHFADFRAVFDYFFPGLMPGSPITIPDEFLDTWEAGFFTDTVRPEVIDPANITRVDQLLNVTGVSPYGYDLPTSTASIENLLWYNVFATNDARAKLGGQPFDNQDREYSGSSDDVTLNQGVERFSADQVALDEIEAHYQTSGELSVPLVTLHTTGDPVVPYWHATRYKGKTIAADNIALHEHFRVKGHGHCSFTLFEVLDAFNRMVYLVENPPQYQPVNRVFLPLTVRGE